MYNFWLCFVPLFVAMDAIGLLPIFMNLTEGLDRASVRRVIWHSMITAAVVTAVFLVAGKVTLEMIGVTLADFMIAGGALLFVISLSDLLTVEKQVRRVDPESMGAVPLGVPLMVGPAVLTTTIILVGEHGYMPTLLAIVVNILIAGAAFSFSEYITRLIGKTGTRTLSKLTALILAVIAVMMVRKGITGLIHGLF